MLKTFSFAAVAVAMSTAALVPSAATAQDYRYDHAYARAYDEGYNRGPAYQDRGYYRDDRAYYRDNRRSYRGNRCDNTAGTIIGAIAGGLLGNGIAGRGDRGVGTVLGAGAGALAGRAIDRSDDPRYCRH